MKVTIKDVHELAKQINTLKGFENVSYNTIGHYMYIEMLAELLLI